jgi:hypothetical protein
LLASDCETIENVSNSNNTPQPPSNSTKPNNNIRRQPMRIPSEPSLPSTESMKHKNRIFL